MYKCKFLGLFLCSWCTIWMFHGIWKRWNQVQCVSPLKVKFWKIIIIFSQFFPRHVIAVAVLLDTFISLQLDYEKNIWIRKDIALSEAYSSYKGSFVINILGQLYFLIPDSDTYIYNVKERTWDKSSPLIKNNVLQESTKLSIARIPST